MQINLMSSCQRLLSLHGSLIPSIADTFNSRPNIFNDYKDATNIEPNAYQNYWFTYQNH
jgi:hypothetical protein